MKCKTCKDRGWIEVLVMGTDTEMVKCPNCEPFTEKEPKDILMGIIGFILCVGCLIGVYFVPKDKYVDLPSPKSATYKCP